MLQAGDLFDLKEGWNLIAIPGPSLTANAVDPFLDRIGNMWTWNGAIFVRQTTVELKKGYWVFYDSSAGATVRGLESDDTSTVLQSGWNLVGLTDTMNCTDLVSNTQLIFPFWTWENNQFTSACDGLVRFVGYWVNTNGPTTIQPSMN